MGKFTILNSKMISESQEKFLNNWITGLRSNVYKQGFGRLHDEYTDCYCALGVGAKANNFTFSHHGTVAKSDDGIIMYDYIPLSVYVEVYRLNDDKHMSFNEIADWLEDNVKLI